MGVPTEILDAYRSRLGRVGVWLGSLALLDATGEQRAARRLEEVGYGSLWAGEAIIGKEVFAHMAILLSATEQIVVGSGIANVWARVAESMQGGASTLGAAWPGRFVLGLGISHAPRVERTGQTYEKPLAKMRQYLNDMDGAVSSAPKTEIAVPRVLGALRSQMLEIAREQADGAHTYFVPTSHTPIARGVLGPDKLLVPEQAVFLTDDPTEGRREARDHMSRFIRQANYANSLRSLGYGDNDFSEGGSDRLIDDIVAWGSEDVIVERVRAHLAGGADHVVLQPLGDAHTALAQLERLAPSLASLS